MYLVIAEKPSLARNIVAGIQSFASVKLNRRDGYFEGGDYLVTWAFGHLFSLCDVEDYTPSPTGKWSLDNIPCFPDAFRFNLRKGADKKPDSGVIKQFETIKVLCNRPDVDTIVNAGDSDREGEIIVRLCISHALAGKKRLTRLWMPDQTPETIKKAFAEMKDETEYDNLANEGFARTYMDWLYGVNLTRYATLRSGSLLRVGRVIVPIVKAIYDRDMSIEHFVPEKYYTIASSAETNGEKIELTSKQKFKEIFLSVCKLAGYLFKHFAAVLGICEINVLQAYRYIFGAISPLVRFGFIQNLEQAVEHSFLSEKIGL